MENATSDLRAELGQRADAVRESVAELTTALERRGRHLVGVMRPYRRHVGLGAAAVGTGLAVAAIVRSARRRLRKRTSLTAQLAGVGAAVLAAIGARKIVVALFARRGI